MNDSLGAVLAIVVLWAILRFAFGGNTSTSPSGNGPTLNSARSRQVPQHMIDAVKTLFPHIPDASISYDLQRSGSVEATCERILNEGGLPAPPAGFFGAAGNRTNTANVDAHRNISPATSPATASAPSKTPTKSPSLISRYGLQSKITSPDASPNSSPNATAGWATTAAERAKILKERKERMILEARMKLQDSLSKNSSENKAPSAA